MVSNFDKHDPDLRDPSLLRIGELGRRVGVRPETLRAWERRYGLPAPQRTESGYRLYSRADEDRVRAMLAWLARGVSASEAARLAREQPPAVERPGDGDGAAAAPPRLADAVGRLVRALVDFDEDTAHATIDEALARYSLGTVLSGLVMPALAEIGTRWSSGRVTVDQEHFCTELLRGRLLGLARGWGGGGGPLALLACPPDERHDLGLVGFGLALREAGWRIAYLGADTPMDALASAAGRLAPAAIVVAATEPARLRAQRDHLRVLGEHHPLLLAGAGASAALASELGAAHLSADPVTAATWLAEQARPTPV